MNQRQGSSEASGTISSLEIEIQRASESIKALQTEVADREAKLTESLQTIDHLKADLITKEETATRATQKLQAELEQSKLALNHTLSEFQESSEQQEQVPDLESQFIFLFCLDFFLLFSPLVCVQRNPVPGGD